MHAHRFLVTLFVMCTAVLVACSPSPSAPSSSGSSAPAAPAVGLPGSGSSGGIGNSKPTQSGILTAGDVDDNSNFQFYQRYLNNTMESRLGQVLPRLNVGERATLHVMGDDRRGIANAWVAIATEGSKGPLLQGYTGVDGMFQFFPTLDGGRGATRFVIDVRSPDGETPLQAVVLDMERLSPDRTLDIPVSLATVEHPRALDMMLAIDTTGSMSDELSYLTSELRNIVETVRGKYPQVSMRFGLVVYRDQGDEYVVRSFDFTDSVDVMQTQLSAQRATGGGDYPEAVDQALAAALNAKWRSGNTARLLFWVADAPSHAERHAAVWQDAQSARRKSIRVYPVAASGVADEAEYLMRGLALITMGRYLFLTDDSGVGSAHAEPKIPCYIVTRLNDLMVRVIDAELAGVRVEPSAEQILRKEGSYDRGQCYPRD